MNETSRTSSFLNWIFLFFFVCRFTLQNTHILTRNTWIFGRLWRRWSPITSHPGRVRSLMWMILLRNGPNKWGTPWCPSQPQRKEFSYPKKDSKWTKIHLKEQDLRMQSFGKFKGRFWYHFGQRLNCSFFFFVKRIKGNWLEANEFRPAFFKA